MFYGVAGKDESGAAKGRDLPSSWIHPLCSFLSLCSPFPLLSPRKPARTNASFLPHGESIRKIQGKSIPQPERSDAGFSFQHQSRRCCHRHRRRRCCRNDPLIKQRCMQMACKEETGSIKTVTMARVRGNSGVD